MPTRRPRPDATKLDDIVAEAHRTRAKREQGYRERALKMYPWVCGRCGREFTSATVHELTVHHRDHDHDNNPADGSNWELLCLYCHDNEHSRLLDGGSKGAAPTASRGDVGTHRPFAELEELLRRKK